jgi:sortase A
VDASRAQDAARRSLESADAYHPAAREPAGATAGHPVPPGSAVATLNIPRVHLSAVVLHGSDARTLRRGPGHLEQTPLPGEPGNIVIAGHRDTFFRPLRWIQVGDSIVLESPRGRFEYRVASLQVVKSDDLSVLEPSVEDVLTLITCYPFNLVGSAPDRFVARAVRVTDAATMTVAAPKTPQLDVARPAVAAVSDDRALVRQAIERFRAAYNARLVSHGELANRGPLTFGRCEAAVTADAATSTCGALEPGGQGQVQVWTFGLTRVDERWTIRSIAID